MRPCDCTRQHNIVSADSQSSRRGVPANGDIRGETKLYHCGRGFGKAKYYWGGCLFCENLDRLSFQRRARNIFWMWPHWSLYRGTLQVALTQIGRRSILGVRHECMNLDEEKVVFNVGVSNHPQKHVMQFSAKSPLKFLITYTTSRTSIPFIL